MDFTPLINKADVLNEALPFIQEFRDSIVVVKFGGSAMEDPELTRKTMRDIVLMEAIGMKTVVVHGGGKAINARLKELGAESRFVNGLRVTGEKTITVVDDVLHNVVNKNLVAGIAAVGGRGVTISGKKIMRAEKLHSHEPATGKDIDIGFVGRVIAIDVKPILDALKYQCIPVVTPLAMDFYGQAYNINADTAACEIAKALVARKLVYLSDVPGVLRDPKDESSLISVICTSEVDSLVAGGIISGGMLPKIRGSVAAIQTGIKKVHLIDGRIPHSLLLELFTKCGIGTEIVAG